MTKIEKFRTTTIDVKVAAIKYINLKYNYSDCIVVIKKIIYYKNLTNQLQ